MVFVSVAGVITNGLEPDFLYPLENVTIPQGRDASFTCVVNNLGGYRVSQNSASASDGAFTRVCINNVQFMYLFNNNAINNVILCLWKIMENENNM